LDISILFGNVHMDIPTSKHPHKLPSRLLMFVYIFFPALVNVSKTLNHIFFGKDLRIVMILDFVMLDSYGLLGMT